MIHWPNQRWTPSAGAGWGRGSREKDVNFLGPHRQPFIPPPHRTSPPYLADIWIPWPQLGAEFILQILGVLSDA